MEGAPASGESASPEGGLRDKDEGRERMRRRGQPREWPQAQAKARWDPKSST